MRPTSVLELTLHLDSCPDRPANNLCVHKKIIDWCIAREDIYFYSSAKLPVLKGGSQQICQEMGNIACWIVEALSVRV